MINEDSHILLIHDEQVPEKLVDKFCSDLKADFLHLQRVTRPGQGPQASLEWLVLPAIAVLILKPYFGGFMAEAGRDHYFVLRRSLKRFWKKIFGKDREFRVAIITSSGEKKQRYSTSFSIYTVADNGHKIKLLFRDDCSEDEYVASIDAFLDFIESYHNRDLLNDCGITLDFEKDVGGQILVEYDRNSKSLRIVNPVPALGNRENRPD